VMRPELIMKSVIPVIMAGINFTILNFYWNNLSKV
jgi:hypothetical protein